MRLLMIALATSCVWPAPSWATERMTPERLWQLRRLGSACVNGQGTLVAYAARQYDLKENTGSSELHLFDLRNERDWVVVRDLKAADSLQLVERPGGLRLFYVGLPNGQEENAQAQVWSVDIAGAAPQQVTQCETGVANLKVSPQGTQIAYTTEVKMDATVNDLYQDLPKADARIIDSLMYRHWNEWHDYAYNHIHVAPLNDDGTAGAARDLMRGLRQLPAPSVRRRRTVQLVARRTGHRLYCQDRQQPGRIDRQ